MNAGIMIVVILFVALGIYLIYVNAPSVLKSEREPVIELNSALLERGSTLKATLAEYEDVYVYYVDCVSPVGWNILKENSSIAWYRNLSICADECKNGILEAGECVGISPQELMCETGCQKLSRIPTLEWDQKFYNHTFGTCGLSPEPEEELSEINGTFIFIEPAEAGEYNIQFEYFTDSNCEDIKVVEKMFKIF